MSLPNSDNKKDLIFSVSIGVFLSVLPVLLGVAYITRNALIPMRYDELGLGIMLCAVLALFPEILKKQKITLFLITILALPSFAISTFQVNFLLQVFLVLLFALTIIFNANKLKQVSLYFLIAGFLVSLFIILLVYSSSAQILSPVYNEIIINGKAVPDTLFHSSLSTSIINEKAVSTRIFGSSSFPYHWFSHFAFAGFAKYLSLSNIGFYNLIYPSLIVPLFIKYLFVLHKEIFSYFKLVKEKYLFIFFPCLLIYFFIILGVGGFPSYLSSESLMLAHILQFIFWTMILKYKSEILEDRVKLLLIFILLVILLFTKVSVGLLTFIPAAYLFFRMSKKKTELLTLASLCLIFVSICYFYFLNIRVEQEDATFITRLFNFNGNVISFFSYSISAVFVLSYIVSEKNSLQKIKEDYLQRKIIPEEIVTLSIIFSFILGMYFGNRKDDSLYFASTYFFINFIVVMIFLAQNIKISSSENRVKWLGFSIVILCFVMSPQFVMIKHNSYNEKRIAAKKDKKMATLLKILSKENFSENTAITIGRKEQWFWKSQFNKITPYFIITGTGNLPALLEISDIDLRSNHYSFPSYKNIYSEINTDVQIRQKALSMGYTSLICIEIVNSKVVLRKIKLK